MSTAPFSLQNHLDRIYAETPRQYALTARTETEYLTWQAAFRSELLRLLKLEDRRPAPLTVEKLGSIERSEYLEEKVSLDVGEGVKAPLYLLIPKRQPPYQAILVFHGHDPSAQYCLGNYPDVNTAQANLAVENNYAQALAKAGYFVCVVEQRGFGERLTDQVSLAELRSCRHLSFFYLLHKRTLLGERIWDGICAASYLLSRSDVAGEPGCTGHSGGGTTSLWLSAIDQRIKTIVVSGYFNSFRGSILSVEHCECNYVPGILDLGEMGDLAALLAPRPFCVIHGEQDTIFPLAYAQEQFETVRRAYAINHANSACQLKTHPGGHAYNHALSLAWFNRWMKQ